MVGAVSRPDAQSPVLAPVTLMRRCRCNRRREAFCSVRMPPARCRGIVLAYPDRSWSSEVPRVAGQPLQFSTSWISRALHRPVPGALAVAVAWWGLGPSLLAHASAGDVDVP